METRDEKVAGAVIKRDPGNGKLVSVTSGKGVSRASDVTSEVVTKVSRKHSDALKRLVNR
jgi:hypothetical protein